MTEYKIGQIFIGDYPTDAAEWCNNNNAYMDEIESQNNNRRFEIKEDKPYEPTPEEKEEQFKREFFNTSLGYVRREVTMKNGGKKDFLSDILPRLRVGVQILTYTKDLQQNIVKVTDEFIKECDEQLLKDFYGG